MGGVKDEQAFIEQAFISNTNKDVSQMSTAI
jgi:hypothetical protein